MIQLSEMLPPRPESWWPLLKQCGVDTVIGLLDGAEQDQRMFESVGAAGQGAAAPGTEPWGEAALARNQATFAEHGFTLIGVEDTAPLDRVRLGLPGRDEDIERVIVQIQAMGRLGIELLCYNWMALGSWGRTDIAIPTRGGALVSGFDKALSETRAPIAPAGEYTHEQLWDALAYFLDAVVPVAEASGVRLGMHPDDPPQSADRGVPRIMNSVAAYRRMLALRPSRSNAITFCQGNWALMPEVQAGEVDLPGLIREFGTDALAFAHVRDVSGTVTDFQETFHDAGQTDMPECLRAYHDIGYEGPIRPDHVPTMAGESNDRPGYEVLGRLFALGYIRGLAQAAYGHPAGVRR